MTLNIDIAATPLAERLLSVTRPAGRRPAILALADGSVFHGEAIGADGVTTGEVVFNTSLTGYQEIVTDPSYARQLVTLTYPHIGNVGVNPEDAEAEQVFAAGLIVRDASMVVSNFRSKDSLQNWLSSRGIVAISEIDTRSLTRRLRETGAQGACILVGTDAEEALRQARSFPGMAGLDLAKEVSTAQPYPWTEGSWSLGEGFRAGLDTPYHVVAYDFGVKRNILRLLADRGCRITVVPAQTPAAEVLALQPNGVFLSNGPGDPEPCTYAIAAAKEFLARRIPVFGICLGHQILGLAVGAKTRKMKFGHHGGNHPVQDLKTGRVFITSQNHGFEVDASTLPTNARVTHVSLFDGSLQGFELTDQPAFCFQGHPEASPGPHEIQALFDTFIAHMQAARA